MKSPSGRMAGQEGARAMEMLTQKKHNVLLIDAYVGMTNEGMQFNQAKMGLLPTEQGM